MVAKRAQGMRCLGNQLSRFSGMLLSLTLLLFHSHSLAKGWNITPTLTLAETFSDNITLASPGNEKSAFVTQVNPGVFINFKNSVNKVNFEYRMQNLFNAGGNGQWNIHHQLDFRSKTRLVRNTLFMDLKATNSQKNTINLNRPNSNLQGNTNRTNVSTVRVSPYWTPHFNGYADGIVRFRYNRVMTNNNVTSDTSIFEESVALKSGKRFTNMKWFTTFKNQHQERTNTGNVTFQNSLSGIRLNVHRKFSLLAQVGHNNSNFNATTTTNQNGVFYSVGGGWKPNSQFFIDAGYGNNIFVTIGMRPIKRMNWISSFRRNKIGTNTGNIWDTQLNYATRRTLWSIRYFEDTLSVQALLSSVQPFGIQNQLGNTITNPINSITNQTGIPLPTLNNQVFTRKRGEISFLFRTGKSNISATLFNVRRTFQVTQTVDDVSGVNAYWSWQFINRSFLFINPLWQHTNNIISTDDRYQVAVGLTRVLPILKFGRRRPVAGSIQYQYSKQTSSLAANEFTENRVTASLIFTF